MSTLSLDSWQMASPYLDQALGMPEEERAVWLASLREQNPPLAALLQTLLNEHCVLARDRFLEESRVPLPGTAALLATRLARTRWCRHLATAGWAGAGL